jgi:hypothetical protein
LISPKYRQKMALFFILFIYEGLWAPSQAFLCCDDFFSPSDNSESCVLQV